MQKNIEQLKNIRMINIDITKKCNYQCEYCIAWAGRDKNHLYQHMEDETIDNLKILFSRVAPNCKLCIAGGEPTLHSRFQEIASAALSLGLPLEIITNFSLPNDLFFPLIDLDKYSSLLCLTLSLHLSQISSPEDFLQKVFELKNYAREKTTIRVTAVVTNNNYNLLKSIEKKLALKNIPLLFNYMRTKDNIPVTYTNKDIHNIYNAWLNTSGKNNYLINCNAGKNYLFITEKGDVARCPDYFHVSDNYKYSLGNINQEINLCKKAEICLSPRCICREKEAPDFL